MSRLPRILYVEDEVDIREIAKFALEEEGFELLFCASGEEALEKVVGFGPDLILLDVMMPGLDGPTTLQKIRQTSGVNDTTVVFLTAKVQPSEVNEFLAMGAVEVIPKPFDPLALPDKIRDILAKQDGK